MTTPNQEYGTHAHLNPSLPAISVALCTYNGERFLLEQLDSIAKQTMLPIELVVSDDGSTDNTLSILKHFAKSAPFPMQIMTTRINLGSTKNFEMAIAACSGPIVAFADQDDIWKSNKLEKIVDALEANPDAAFVITDSELIDAEGNPLRGTAWEWHEFDWASYNKQSALLQFRLMIRGSFVTGATMAFRARLFPLLRPFPAEWYHDAWLASVAHGCGYRGFALPEPLISYRQHAKQQIGVTRRVDLFGGAKRWLFRRTQNHEKLAAACATQALGYDQLVERLETLATANSQSTAELAPLVKRAARHQRRRGEMFRANRIRRLELVVRELLNGGYHEFSGSWWRAVRDLFL